MSSTRTTPALVTSTATLPPSPLTMRRPPRTGCSRRGPGGFGVCDAAAHAVSSVAMTSISRTLARRICDLPVTGHGSGSDVGSLLSLLQMRATDETLALPLTGNPEHPGAWLFRQRSWLPVPL